MKLHARNIAVSAGTPPALVPEVVAYMTSRGTISAQAARDYMKAQSLFEAIREEDVFQPMEVLPSTFHIRLTNLAGVDEIELNVALLSLGESTHISIEENKPVHPLQEELFGKGKG